MRCKTEVDPSGPCAAERQPGVAAGHGEWSDDWHVDAYCTADEDACRSADRPYLASRLQGFGTTVFAEMSALAERTGVDQPGPGLPRPGRPAGGGRGGHRRHPGRPQPVPARARASSSCARPSPGISSASTASSSTPTARSWSPPAPPRPSPPPCWPSARPATRWWSSSPSTTPTARPSPWPGPSRRVVPLEPPDWTFDPGAPGGRRHPPHPPDPAQHARTTRPARSSAGPELEPVADLLPSSTTCWR